MSEPLIIRREQMRTFAQGSSDGTAVAPCRPTVDTWIEIELVGEDGSPVPGEQYEIRLPDGRILQGRLDGRGLARIVGIVPGQCALRFPALDDDAWEPC